MFLDLLKDAFMDCLSLLPFLFLTYLALEILEHKMADKTQRWIARAGKLGPFYGGLLGMIPQCGFSAAASNLYAGRIITVGTLVAVFLSTSDEMLPIFLSQQVAAGRIVKILLLKAALGIAWGFLLDLVWRRRTALNQGSIQALCQKEHCQCETGIFRGAISHTLNVWVFIFLISLALGAALELGGQQLLSKLFLGTPGLGVVLAGLVGLIPNCGASVVLTQLFLDGLLSFGAMMAGLLVGAGVGLLVLFRVNRNAKENLQIVGILYMMGIITGFILQWTGLTV